MGGAGIRRVPLACQCFPCPCFTFGSGKSRRASEHAGSASVIEYPSRSKWFLQQGSGYRSTGKRILSSLASCLPPLVLRSPLSPRRALGYAQLGAALGDLAVANHRQLVRRGGALDGFHQLVGCDVRIDLFGR